MPDIGHIGFSPALAGVSPVARITPEAASRGAAEVAGAGSRGQIRDRVELSEHARLLDRLRSMPEYRADKVAEARTAIETGAYESPARLQAAIDRLLRDLDGA